MERSSKQDRPDDDDKPTLPTADQQLFMGTVVTLTWQLLIVVVVPFVGGHYLDEHLGTTPLWTLVGLGITLALAGLATYRGYQTLSKSHARNK